MMINKRYHMNLKEEDMVCFGEAEIANEEIGV